MCLLKKKKIARISTVPFFVGAQLNEQIKEMLVAGFNVSIITSPSAHNEQKNNYHPDVSLIEIEISRKINIKKDIKALLQLYKCFKKNRFDLVHSTTPKAGLLTALAGFASNVPFRIHTFTGQQWVGKKGIIRELYKIIDKIIIKLNHCCYTDSHSQKKFLLSENICKNTELKVLGEGSLAGVDLSRFNPEKYLNVEKNILKEKMQIGRDSTVLIFVGRITKDKGILELIKAFNMLLDKGLDVILLLVGPVDEQILIENISLESYVLRNKKIKFLGFTSTPEKFLAISDIFCLPSYREGFGTVILESAAMRLPTVGSNIYGISDAVQNGKTGLLVEMKNVNLLFKALFTLVINKSFRIQLGTNALNRVCSHFDSKYMNSLVVKEYFDILENYGEEK